MKRLYQSFFVPSLLLTFLFILSGPPSQSFAQPLDDEYASAPLPQDQIVLPAAPEPWAASGHPLGDTIARGIDFLLRPAYSLAACGWFSAFGLPEPRSITELTMTGCPPEPSAPVVPGALPPLQPPALQQQPAPAQPSAPLQPAVQ